MTLDQVLTRLYESEINVSIVSFWDGGYEVGLGDRINGFRAENTFWKAEAIAPWLDAQARRHYPKSEYAAQPPP